MADIFVIIQVALLWRDSKFTSPKYKQTPPCQGLTVTYAVSVRYEDKRIRLCFPVSNIGLKLWKVVRRYTVRLVKQNSCKLIGTGYMLSRAWHRLLVFLRLVPVHIFPRLASATFTVIKLPALGTVYTASLTSRLREIPETRTTSYMVKYFPEINALQAG